MHGSVETHPAVAVRRLLAVALALQLSSLIAAHAQLQYVPYAAAVGMKVCGVESRDGNWQFAVDVVAAMAVSAGVTYTLKEAVHEWRPDDSDRHSFPSGHAAMAFSGAALLHHQYGHLSPWVTVSGYAYALGVAVERVCSERHYVHDVAAGAAIGYLSAELSFWVTDKIFPDKDVSVSLSPGGLHLAYAF